VTGDDERSALYRCPLCGAELEGTPQMRLMCTGTTEEPHAPVQVMRAIAPQEE
jgi:hypothetical protein